MEYTEVFAGRWFAFLTCPVCAVEYMIPKGMHEPRAQGRIKDSWHCPNGHSLIISDGELDKLRRERDRLRQENARLEEERLAALRTAERAKAETGRVKRRANAGVCPCCSRTFQNVQRHIATKHPELAPKTDERRLTRAEKVAGNA